jgi:hypothetical protein
LGSHEASATAARREPKHTYDKEITALLVVDPYNDSMSEGGKIWPRIRAVAEANRCAALASSAIAQTPC